MTFEEWRHIHFLGHADQHIDPELESAWNAALEVAARIVETELDWMHEDCSVCNASRNIVGILRKCKSGDKE